MCCGARRTGVVATVKRGRVVSVQKGPVQTTQVEYIGERSGSFTVTGPSGRGYRVSGTYAVITIDVADLEYLTSRPDFIAG